MAKYGGVNTEGDVLVNETSDGIKLEVIYEKIKGALDLWNTERTSVASLISHFTTDIGSAIPQGVVPEKFETASEFGVPQAIREPATALKCGFTFEDYDAALRSSWRYLRSATAEQVYASTNRALEADNALANGSVMRRLFNPAPEENEYGITCYGVWANDGISPMPYLGKTFDGTHTHALASGAASIDSGDVEILINHVREHGFGRGQNSRLVILANPAEAQAIQSWRAGVVNANSQKASFDFVYSSLAIPFLTTEHIVGEIPPAEFGGLEVQGSYGGAFLVQTDYVPQGWFAVVSTSGPGSKANPFAIRQHPNPSYQGLRLIPGNQQRYPLIESFFQRSFGVGTKQRGGAAVMQITASGSYTAPANSAFGLA